MNKKIIILSSMVMLWLLISCINLLIFNYILSYIFLLLSLLITLSSGMFLVKIYGVKSNHGIAFLRLSIGIAMLFLGFALLLFPTLRSLSYILFFCFSFMTIDFLIKEIKLFKIEWKKNIFRFRSIIISVIAIILLIYTNYLLAINKISFIDKLSMMALSLFDFLIIIIFVLILSIAKEYKGGKLYLPWIIFFTGEIFLFIGDLLASMYFKEYEMSLNPTNIIELFYITSFLLISFSLFYMGFNINEVGQKYLRKFTTTKRKRA